jgi:ankyrin repeat protein
MKEPTSWDQYGEFGSASVVQKLVSRGGNPFESNYKQQNALHLASGAGNKDSVIVLLSYDLNLQQRNRRVSMLSNMPYGVGIVKRSPSF